jgi:hypothetical protein
MSAEAPFVESVRESMMTSFPLPYCNNMVTGRGFGSKEMRLRAGWLISAGIEAEYCHTSLRRGSACQFSHPASPHASVEDFDNILSQPPSV